MVKEVFYTYLGTNGVLTSPIFLEGIYSVKKIRLIPESNKILTKDGEHFFTSVDILADEEKDWYEVDIHQLDRK